MQRSIAVLRPSATPPPTLAVVIAGAPLAGESLLAIDPLSLRIGGATVLERLSARMRLQCRDVVVAQAFAETASAASCNDPGTPVIPLELDAGPLAKIAQALDWTRANRPGVDWILTVPATMPFLPDDLLGRLHAGRTAAASETAFAVSAGRTHPSVCLWPVMPQLVLDQADGNFSSEGLAAFLTQRGAVAVEWSARPFDRFFAVERLEDVVEAERIASSLGRIKTMKSI
jgi:molybdopterin-guanine dinucleotide biosynthesis protein A